jgi:GTPase SAR1 family protein
MGVSHSGSIEESLRGDEQELDPEKEEEIKRDQTEFMRVDDDDDDDEQISSMDIKVLLVGSTNIGKTAFRMRVLTDTFTDDLPTVGSEFFTFSTVYHRTQFRFLTWVI